MIKLDEPELLSVIELNKRITDEEISRLRTENEDLKSKNISLATQLLEILDKVNKLGEPLPLTLTPYGGLV